MTPEEKLARIQEFIAEQKKSAQETIEICRPLRMTTVVAREGGKLDVLQAMEILLEKL